MREVTCVIGGWNYCELETTRGAKAKARITDVGIFGYLETCVLVVEDYK